MITENELLEAIAECQGVRHPNSGTCIKLASFYTILDHLRKKEEVEPAYSFTSAAENVIGYQSDTEFAEAIHGRDVNDILEIIDELMTTLSVVNPPLYSSVMRRVAK